MLATLRQRNFALLWGAGLISMLGYWVLFIALPFYIYTLTGSALATGLMFIVETLPPLLLGSVAGVFVDRWDRRRTLIGADLLRGTILLALLVPRSSEWLGIVYVVAFAQSTVAQFFGPAKGALVPRLVGERHLVAANGLDALSNNLTRLIGPTLGGALLAWLGFTSVVLVDAISFFVSGMLIALIALPDAPGRRSTEPASGSVAPSAMQAWQEWIDGLRLVRRERLVGAIFAVMGVAMIAEGILNVYFFVFVKTILHGDAVEMGWITSAQAIGGLLGGMALGQAGRRMAPGRLVGLGAITLGSIDLIMFNSRSLPVALVLVAIAGIAVVALFVSLQTLLQAAVPDRYRGRIFGAFGTTTALLLLVGRGLATLFGDALGPMVMLNSVGLLDIVAGMVALVVLAQPGGTRRWTVVPVGQAPDTA